MEIWVLLAIAAAFFQALRFMLQKQLSGAGLSPVTATYVRFAYSAPLVAGGVALWLLWSGQGVPALLPGFWISVTAGGLCQILATVCVVALFKQRNFAVGITLKKSEVLLTALVGFAVLGDRVTWAGAGALLLGACALLILSKTPKGAAAPGGRSVALGLLSGVFFAFSAVAYRAGVLAVETDLLALRAAFALGAATVFQTAVMTLWLALRETGQLRAAAGAWRSASVLGLSSLAGSLCWFAAFALQSAAYVFAVGQVEVIFSLAIGALVFSERITGREALGITLLLLSILGVTFAG
ncbi:DMT family transporter [Alphaproteobacteria bacterium KMM 3653]|uniref:DMT family transporter n=1 Tax=Harenicola maris TaxID=2841044 RepID=A0AAP2CSC2_9RHOB|nr:DMT family transporter [Harenicola maris]